MILLIVGLMTIPETAQAQRRGNGSIRHSSTTQRQSRARAPERRSNDTVVRRDDRSDQAERRDNRDDRRDDRQDRRDDRWDDRHHHRHHHYHRHGHVVVDLPHGHIAVAVGGTRYHYYGGVYYRSGPSGFVVVAAPVGAVIVTLPVGYTTVYVGEAPYYYYSGSYYIWRPGIGYVVVGTPIGATVAYLPDGYTTVYVGGVRYYQFGGVHYRPYYRNGATVYVSVRL